MGVNKNAIPDGVVAYLLFSVSATTVNPQTAVNLTSALASGAGATPLAAGATGNNVTIGSVNSSTLNITTSALPASQINTAYAQTLSATGGTAPYTWSILSGLLPPGMSLSASGIISGKPTTTGTFAFIVQVTDSTKPLKSQAFIIGRSPTRQ